MDKTHALQAFWGCHGLPAYDIGTVPEDAVMPYITYDVATDSLGTVLSLSGSLWYNSLSWNDISDKAEEIAQYIATMDPPTIEIDGGRLYVTMGAPFAQRITDPDPFIRRVLININVEFFTAY